MLNNVFFPQENSQYPLGDFCHQQTQASVPVWVLTDLQGNLLLANEASNEYVSEWLVTGGRITINRFFQACTAMIVCSAQVINQNNLYPNLPTKVARAQTLKIASQNGTYSTWTTDLNYPLTKNDEVAIWCGYINSRRLVTKEDLGINLIRRFVGVIDTIACAGTSTQGVNLIIQCRDRTRYLMDSMGTFNSTDFNPIYNNSEKRSTAVDIAKQESTVGGAKYKIKRKDVILEMARRSIGHLGGAESISSSYKQACDSVGGMRILEGYIRDYGDIEVSDPNSSLTIDDVYNPENSKSTPFGYAIAKDKVPFLGGSTRTDKISLEQPDLVFNILTGRLPYQIQSENQSWLGNNQTVTDRVPAEFIKYLSLQEPWPTEFFCDSRTGEYWYAPRGIDISGLTDPKRFFRTYVFRKSPPSLLKTLLTAPETVAAARNKLSKSLELGDYTGFNSGKAIDDINRAVSSGSAVTIGEGYQISAEAMQKLGPLAGLEINKDDDTELPFINFNEKLSSGKTLLEELSILDGNGESVINISGGITDIKRSLINQRIYYLDQVDPTQAVGKIPEGDDSVHACQAALLFREESSIINWRSNIIVSNQGTAENSTQSAVHIKLNPSWLQGRNFACSYFNVVDQTVGSNVSELVALAMSFARIYGKELRAATMHVLGDPSITPGEVIQVIGSPLHPEVYVESSKEYWKTERTNFSSYSEGYKALNNKLLEMKRDDPRNETNSVPVPAKQPTPENLANPKEHIPAQATGINATQTAALTQAQLMCPAAFGAAETPATTTVNSPGSAKNNGLPAPTTPEAAPKVPDTNINVVTFPQDPQSIWRVEAVIEKFNEQPGSGYKTEIALLSPF